MNSDDDKKRALASKIEEVLVKSTTKPRVRKKTTDIITINITAGNGDGHGIGNTIIKTEKVVHKPKIQVKTGDGVVTAEQKARIQQLVKDWISTHDAVKQTKLTPAAAWSITNKQAGVNSYHEIPAEKFDKIEKWLLKQIALVNAMPSAKKKSSTWRATRIKGIQSRCNELGMQVKRKEYMKKYFGKDSLTMLSDDDVEKVYRWVMSQK